LFQPIERVTSFHTSLSLRMIGRTLLIWPAITSAPDSVALISWLGLS
jgi:hypothetical protein